MVETINTQSSNAEACPRFASQNEVGRDCQHGLSGDLDFENQGVGMAYHPAPIVANLQ
jgi:hypothetical protein